MTFSKPLTGSFSFEGVIPSAAMNIINNAIPNALDKTGDNSTTSPSGGITGRIDVLSGGSILGQLGSLIGVESGGLLFVNGGEFNIVNNGQVNFGGDSSAPSLNMLGSTSQTFSAGTSLNINAGANLNIASQTTSHGLTLGTGCIQSSLSFGSQVGTIFIEQVAQTATAANGNPLWLIAQAGGNGATTTGGTLILQGGVGGATGGNVELVGGIGSVPGNILLSSSSFGGEIISFSTMIQKNWQGTNTGQGQQIIEFAWMGQSTGSSTPTYTIGTLPTNTSAAVEVSYTFRNISNIADSGFGKVHAIITATGSGTAGGVTYGAAPSSGGNPPEPVSDDVSFFGGPSYGFSVNGNSFSGTYNWTVWARVIIN